MSVVFLVIAAVAIVVVAASEMYMPLGADVEFVEMGEGVTVARIFAKGGGSENMDALSAFDKEYLCCGHGGNPVAWDLPAPVDLSLSLLAGDNVVDGLLPCSGVDQIKTIEVFSDTKDLRLVFTKYSSSSAGQPIKRCETSRPMDCRTMFVPYKDTYTTLTIHSPENCRLVFNRVARETDL